MTKVLIPNGYGQNVLSAARALAREKDIIDIGFEVSAIQKIFKSRYIHRFLQMVSPSSDDTQYVKDVLRLCSENGYDMILPLGNDAYFAVVKHSNALEKVVRFLAPKQQPFYIAHDKLKTIKLSNDLGIPCPKLYSGFSDADVQAIANDVRYPAVIKARSGTGVQRGLRYANNREELLRKYEEISENKASNKASNYESPLIQEFIPGYIHDACTLSYNGEVVNVMTQVRWLMYPIQGGVGAVNITTHDHEVKRLAYRLLEALEWNGPAQIEFKCDPRDGQYKIIEINPKLWGTLDLSIKVGMNFPGMIRDLLLEKPVQYNQNYPAGVRYIFQFHQASFAYVQILKTFGLSGLLHFKRGKYLKTFRDIDWFDPLPDGHRGFVSMANILRGKVFDENSNIPTGLIPIELNL